MKISDYIRVDSDIVYNNKEFRLYYDGYLTEVSNNEPILLKYGDQDWKNVKTIEMKKDENDKLYANIKLNNFEKMNFCFEYNGVWDNNFSNDYSFELSKFDLSGYENDSEDELSEHFSNDFLLAYNLNNAEAHDIPEVTTESNVFENASNINLLETELENLKETLDRLFPEEKSRKVQAEHFEDNLATLFADSFTTSSLSENDFVEIDYTDDELEVYLPVKPYKQVLLAKVKERNIEKDFISSIVLEDEKVLLKSKVQYIHTLRQITKKKELAQILRLSTEDEAQFLVVSPYSELDIYDNSLFGTIKRLTAYATKSVRKIYYYLRENLGTNDMNR